jgi:nucleotidyltransferase/DNA polymerase involved in DNA repair
MLTPALAATTAVPVGTSPLIAALCFDPLPLYLAQRADPALARAALVCAEDGRVLHASAAAHRLGITPGMRLSGARMRVEGLRVVEPREPEVEHAWEGLLRELYAMTPWLEQGRRGRLFLRLGAEEAQALAARYGIRVGVAAAREIAELAALSSRPGECRAVAPGDEEAFLMRLPLRFLKGVGASGKNLTRLSWLGLATAGELRRWSASQLRSYLGTEGDVLLPYLHGPYRTHLHPHRPPEVLQRSLLFEEPAREPRELLPALERLSVALERALAGRAARRLTLTAGLAGQQRSATRLSKRPLARARQIRQQALFALRDSGAAAAGIERLTLELAAPRRLGLQSGLWHAREERQRALEAALERYPHAMVRFAWRDPYAEADDLAWGWERLTPASVDDAGDPSRPVSRRGRPDGIADPRRLLRAAAVPLFSGLADDGASAPTPPHPVPSPLRSPLPEDLDAHAHAPRPGHPARPTAGAGELAGTGS